MRGKVYTEIYLTDFNFCGSKETEKQNKLTCPRVSVTAIGAIIASAGKCSTSPVKIIDQFQTVVKFSFQLWFFYKTNIYHVSNSHSFSWSESETNRVLENWEGNWWYSRTWIYRISADCKIYPIHTKKFLSFCIMRIENFIRYNRVRYIYICELYCMTENILSVYDLRKDTFWWDFWH